MDDTVQRINEKVCKTAEEFNALVSKFIDELVPQQVIALQKKIALQALDRIVRRTPVDTGRARGNWQTTIGEAPETENLLEDPIQAGMSVLKAIRSYTTVFISNNVSYIIYLEDGSSWQAPNGMVSLTFEELQAQFA